MKAFTSLFFLVLISVAHTQFPVKGQYQDLMQEVFQELPQVSQELPQVRSIQGQTQDQIQEHIQGQTQDQIQDQTQGQTQDQIQDQTQDQTQDQIQDQTQSQTPELAQRASSEDDPVEDIPTHGSSQKTSPCVFTIDGTSEATCSGAILADLKTGTFDQDPALLKTLNLLDCSLHSLPARALNNMPGLQELTIARSSLSEITAESFKGIENLQYLNLSHNDLTNLDSPYFSLLKGLTRLNLTSNFITSIKGDSFNGLSMLQVLDLTGNVIESLVPATFRATPSLVWVDLSGNLLTKLPGRLFVGLQYLLSVDLCNNKLTQIPEKTFDNVPNLSRLVLSNNTIRAFSPEIFVQPQPKLQSLKIDSNDLTHLDVDRLIPKLPGLRRVDLSPNPWRCSCLHLILAWMDRKKVEYLPRDYFVGKVPSCVILKTLMVLDPVTGEFDQPSPEGCGPLTVHELASLRNTYRMFSKKTSKAIKS